ncbi:hypothetical protein DBB_46170 [Desulfoluna spongiiphila]|nr:hypothetical protein DBB_46170 [Desulfoluna spongiiphila]
MEICYTNHVSDIFVITAINRINPLAAIEYIIVIIFTSEIENIVIIMAVHFILTFTTNDNVFTTNAIDNIVTLAPLKVITTKTSSDN